MRAVTMYIAASDSSSFGVLSADSRITTCLSQTVLTKGSCEYRAYTPSCPSIEGVRVAVSTS